MMKVSYPKTFLEIVSFPKNRRRPRLRLGCPTPRMSSVGFAASPFTSLRGTTQSRPRPVGYLEKLCSLTATIPNTVCAPRLELSSLFSACDRRSWRGRFWPRSALSFKRQVPRHSLLGLMRPRRLRRSQAMHANNIKNTKISSKQANTRHKTCAERYQ
jgi:hypothetical protein